MGLGWALDRYLGTGWMMVAGIILGAAVGFYQFVRIMSRLNK
jgi:F0F1-type ATP synthase assembly protein I